MSNYRKTMADALQEMYLSEDNMELMRKAAGGAAQTVKMKDGKLQMDGFTASAIMQVYDKVNPANQKKMAVMINKGTKAGMMKLQSFAMKQVKSENDPEIEEEVELDEGQEKGPKQLTNPNKEVMVVKKNKVIVINKKDQDKYLKQGWTLAEEVELDEAKSNFEVKYAKSKNAPIKVAKFVQYDQARKFLHNLRKDGMNGIISKDGKPVKEEAEVDEQWEKKLKKIRGNTAGAEGQRGAIEDDIAREKEKKNPDKKLIESELDEFTISDLKGMGIKPTPAQMKELQKINDKNRGNITRTDLKKVGIKEEADLDEGNLNDYVTKFKQKLGKTTYQTMTDWVDGIGGLTKREASTLKLKLKPFTEEVDLDEYRVQEAFTDVEIDEAKKVGDTVTVKGKKGKIVHITKGQGGRPKKAFVEFSNSKKTPAQIPLTDLDEGKMSQLHQYIKDKKSAEEIAKLMKVDVKTIKALMSSHHPEDVEEGAAADARKAMSRDPDFSRKDSADDDDIATDDDIKGASKNIIMQLRKSISLKGKFDVEFLDKKKFKVPAKMAQAVTQKYNSLKKPADKEKFQAQIAKSYKDMLKTLKAGYGEQKESILERLNRKIKENKDG